MDKDLEDLLVSGINDMAVKASKQFSFKKKEDQSSPAPPPKKNYASIFSDDEDEGEETDEIDEDASLSANFSLEEYDFPTNREPPGSSKHESPVVASTSNGVSVRQDNQDSPVATSTSNGVSVRQDNQDSPVAASTSNGVSVHKDNWDSPVVTARSDAFTTPRNQMQSPKVIPESDPFSLRRDRYSPAGSPESDILSVHSEDRDSPVIIHEASSVRSDSPVIIHESDSFSIRSGNKDSPIVVPESDDDDVQEIASQLNRIPIGHKVVNKEPPKKTIFLNEPPPIEKKTYAYNPADAKHQEFFGDVQRTISLLAKTIDEMPHPEDKENISLPRGLVELFDHQKYGLRWLSWREREFPGGGILADEMGLGKTIMIIALIMKSKMDIEERGDDSPMDEREFDRIQAKTTLVVCPVGCIVQWDKEIRSKGKGLSVYTFHGAPQRKISAAVLAQYDVVLSTYSTVASDVGADDDARAYSSSKLRRLYWRRIVLDESHSIRNPKAKCTQAVCKLSARHRWAVTGTPIHNYPSDFFSMTKFLRMKPFDDAKTWDFWIGMKQIRKASDAQQRLNILGKALILRRTKVEVEAAGGNVKKIPPKTVEVVEIELSEEERRVYDYLMQFAKQMFAKFLEEKENHERELNAAAMTYSAAKHRSRKQKSSEEDGLPQDIRFSHLFALLTRLRQCAVLPHLIHTMLEDEDIDDDISFDAENDEHIISNRNPVFDRMYLSSKLKKIIADLEELRQVAEREERPMDKVVMVSSSTVTLQIFHDHLRARGFSCIFITGKEDANERALNMDKFNKRPNRDQICLLSLMAGGVGLNLVGGNNVFFIEPHWNPQMELQAQDRVHRFGQTKNVTVKRYITKDTVESRIQAIQTVKINLADGVLNSSKRTRGTGLSIHQLHELFK